jgi:sigma-B regulation protein RsbU (phosphoserine phosphatase)
MPDLVITPKAGTAYTIKLDQVRTTLGRSSRNDVCLSDPFASRFHIELRRDGEDFTVSDVGSANGTILNGKPLARPTRMQDEDELRIGETTLRFVRDAAGANLSQTSVLWTDAAAAPAPEVTIASPLPSTMGSGFLSALRTTSSETSSSGVAQAVSEAIERRDLLAVVSKVGVALLSDTSLDETLKLVVDLVFDAIPAERGFLFLWEGGDLLLKVSRTRRGQGSPPTTADVQISRSISERVFREGVAVLTSDALHDPRFQGSNSIMLSAVRSVMAVPLILSRETFGMIYVDNPFDSRFTEEDLQVLTTIAGVASIKIENAKLAEERLEKRRMQEELKVASEIQMRLQPACPPPIEGYAVCAYSIPSREIGGDYYDYIERKKQRRLAITLGDVSGKGIGAALLMSSLHAAVRAQTQTSHSIREMMSNLNDYIAENSPDNKFLTLFYSELDTLTGDLYYANAGHNAPILVRAAGGHVERLDATGLPIGILHDSRYTEACVRLWPGDVLVVYSDGISESVNTAEDEFGDERLVEVVRKNIHHTASKIRDRVDEALSRFVGTAAPVDDMTLLIVKRIEEK